MRVHNSMKKYHNDPKGSTRNFVGGIDLDGYHQGQMGLQGKSCGIVSSFKTKDFREKNPPKMERDDPKWAYTSTI